MDGLKNAVLIPLINELSSTVVTENNKNYRPVSNRTHRANCSDQIGKTYDQKWTFE